MRPEDRERIQIEVVHRIVDRFVRKAKDAPEGFLLTVVNDTIYHERKRLEHASKRSLRARRDTAFVQRLQRRLRNASETTLRMLVERIARQFVAEIVGNFDDRVYRLTTTLVPHGLSVLLHATHPAHLLNPRGMTTRLNERLRVQGAVERLQHLAEKGTVVVLPTHSSNLDSIIMGYATYLVRLPPLLYGAGINLFTNPMISFFMHNLGAYRVDRKKQAILYKDVLKEYATCALEMGYHQLFFPGGTRSRSGAIEQRLKKGLLGTLMRAYVNNLIAERPKSKIFVVPCTLCYKLVLEGESLIGSYLKETGKTSYVSDEDEFSRPRRIFKFFNDVVTLNDDITVTFSPAMDILGNPVDEEGNSLDPKGRIIDPADYMMQGGRPQTDDQRDAEYTNELADAVSRNYLRDNVIMSTHLVGRALFNLIRAANPQLNLYRLLRTGGETPSFSIADLLAESDRLLDVLGNMPDGPRKAELLESGDMRAIVDDALAHFGIYHSRPAAERRGERVFHRDRNLLFYYGNRLNGYGLGDIECE